MYKKIPAWMAAAALLVAAWILIQNLDIFLRLWKAGQAGNLTEQKIRYEVAAFNLGRQSGWI